MCQSTGIKQSVGQYRAIRPGMDGRPTLYRRHRRDCTAGHQEDARTGELEERKKGWRGCNPIFVSGRLVKKFRRQSTGKWEWDTAKAILAVWEAVQSWGRHGSSRCRRSPALSRAHRDRRAIIAFLADLQVAPNTRKKYTLLMNALQAFTTSRGCTLLDQLTVVEIREFRASWKIASKTGAVRPVQPQTAAKNMSTIKSFFDFCVANEWLPKNPARLIKSASGRDAADRRNEHKLPFSDPELRSIYEACETKYGKQEIRWSRAIHDQRVTGAV